MSVAELRQIAGRTRENLEALKRQLAELEASEISDDLVAAVNRQSAITTARTVIAEREQELQEQEGAALAAELEERKRKSIAALEKRAEKASERFNDSVMALTSALAELNAVNEASITIGNGAIFAAVGIVKIPPMVVRNEGGRSYRMGTV